MQLVIGTVPAVPVLLVWLWWRARRSEPDARPRAWAWFATVLISYLVLAYIPVRAQPWLVQTPWFRWLLEYFSVRMVYRDGKPLQPGQYLFLMMPHGLYPWSGACATVSKLVDVFFRMRMASAPALFRVPLIRQLLGWIGSIPADRASMSAALKNGESIGLYPGGIAETVRTDYSSERLLLKSRRGFVHLAFQHGTPIVPVYVFGQSILWSQLRMPRWVETLSRWLHVTLFIPYGRFGTLIPRKLPLLFAVGSPIVCSRKGEPTPEEVETVLGSVVASVEDLFQCYKGLYGWSDRPLIID